MESPPGDGAAEAVPAGRAPLLCRAPRLCRDPRRSAAVDRSCARPLRTDPGRMSAPSVDRCWVTGCAADRGAGAGAHAVQERQERPYRWRSGLLHKPRPRPRATRDAGASRGRDARRAAIGAVSAAGGVLLPDDTAALTVTLTALGEIAAARPGKSVLSVGDFNVPGIAWTPTDAGWTAPTVTRRTRRAELLLDGCHAAGMRQYVGPALVHHSAAAFTVTSPGAPNPFTPSK